MSNVCAHCGGDVRIRNPKGFCDHLHYPENCKVCQEAEAKMEGSTKMVAATQNQLQLYVDGNITPEGIDLVRKTVAKDANDLELQMFLHICKQNALDPFLKEIYFMKRKVWNHYKSGYDEIPTMMVGRDGFLTIAHRSGQFGGMKTVVLFIDKNGDVKEGEIAPPNSELIGAKCSVWNKSFSQPVEVSVKFEEYCVYRKDDKTGKQVPQALWASKGETMIKKVAEAQALRKAFNVHGVYGQEEMEAEISRDSMTEIEHTAEQVEMAEKIHGLGKEPYDVWSNKVMTAILDALQECKSHDELWKIKGRFEDDVKNLVEADRQYILDMYENQMANIEHDDNALPVENVLKKSKVPEKTAQDAPVEAQVVPEEETATKTISGKASPSTPAPSLSAEEVAELNKRDEFGKKFAAQAAADIKACATAAQLTLWKQKNISTVMSLLPQYRDYVKAQYNAGVARLTEK